MAGDDDPEMDQEMSYVQLSLDDIHPTAHNTVKELTESLKACKVQITELMQANQQLRQDNLKLHQHVESLLNGGALPRKLPKPYVGTNTDSINASTTLDNNDFNQIQHSVRQANVVSNNSININNNSDINSHAATNNINSGITSHTAATIIDRGTNNATNSNLNASVQTANRKKVIQVIDTDLKTVKDKIKASNCKSFTLHQKSKVGPIKVAINNNNEIAKIRETLINSGLSFHEFKWKEEKQRCFVLKGLIDATADDIPYIKQELVNAGLPNSIVLLHMTTGYMRANPDARHNSLFKLIVPPNFDDKLLDKVKFLDHVAVVFERLMKKSVMQCKNCQRFGHSTGGCQHPHRCVKCGENHYRDNCERTFSEAVKLKCCNCGGEHTANNLTHCQYFLSLQAKKNASIKVNTLNAKKVVPNSSNSTNQTKSSKITSGLSFAQVTSSRRNNDNHGTIINHGYSINHANNNKNTTNIEQKLDMLIEMVARHDTILKNWTNNG